MSLKNIELAMAQDIPLDIKEANGIAQEYDGIIIVETLNPDLRTEFKKMPKGGIREYLLSLGKFADIPLT